MLSAPKKFNLFLKNNTNTNIFVAEDSGLEEDSQCQVLLLLIKLIMVIHCHQIPLCLQKYEPKMNDFMSRITKKLHFRKYPTF